MKKRFFCSNCRHFLSIFLVDYDEYQRIYYCRYCGEPVMRVSLIKDAIIKDYIRFIIKEKKEEDFQ